MSKSLIRILCGKYDLELVKDATKHLIPKLPNLVTPGAAESLAVKVYRLAMTKGVSADAALESLLGDYQSPAPEDIMNFQIQLAVEEASDLSFVLKEFIS
jgi:hypothetical protein